MAQGKLQKWHSANAEGTRGFLDQSARVKVQTSRRWVRSPPPLPILCFLSVAAPCSDKYPESSLESKVGTAEIAAAYERGDGSFRKLAGRFGGSLGTVQRCVAPYQRASAKAAVNG